MLEIWTIVRKVLFLHFHPYKVFISVSGVTKITQNQLYFFIQHSHNWCVYYIEPATLLDF